LWKLSEPKWSHLCQESKKEIKIEIMIAGRQWLMPIILATQEVEIRRITVQGQPRQKLRPYHKNTKHTKKGLVEWVVEVIELASMMSWVQTAVFPKKKKKKKRKKRN
jgi:hypothetical protein